MACRSIVRDVDVEVVVVEVVDCSPRAAVCRRPWEAGLEIQEEEQVGHNVMGTDRSLLGAVGEDHPCRTDKDSCWEGWTLDLVATNSPVAGNSMDVVPDFFHNLPYAAMAQMEVHPSDHVLPQEHSAAHEPSIQDTCLSEAGYAVELGHWWVGSDLALQDAIGRSN